MMWIWLRSSMVMLMMCSGVLSSSAIHGSPVGWVVPPDGATMQNPASPRVSARTSTPPFSPGRLASLVLPGTLWSVMR